MVGWMDFVLMTCNIIKWFPKIFNSVDLVVNRLDQ